MAETFDRACRAEFTLFNDKGIPVGGGTMTLPDFLDWMPIESKTFWFLSRGYGPDDAKHLLLRSQGELQLSANIEPLTTKMTLAELKEKTNDLEDLVEQHARENGLSRTPRNQ